MDGKVSRSGVSETCILKIALDVANLYYSDSRECRLYVHIIFLYIQKILL